MVSGVAANNTVGSGYSSSHVAADTGATSQHMSQPINQSGGSDGSTTTTYAGVTASNCTKSGIGQNNNLREAVSTAVFADQRDEEQRSKSIIVSGLNSSGDSSDSVSFQRLCMLELGIEPVITYTRRLGHLDGSRVRPLLVGLQSADEASHVLGHAKKLQRSTDDNVHNNVYINKNLSKLEAQLALKSVAIVASVSKQHVG